jgi:predicted dinucleotide-binding enzyme
MSAFFLFAGDERAKVKAANPSASIGDIGKELGARWAKLGGGAKAGYEKKAAVLKVKQQAEMAKYKAAKAKTAGPKRALSAFFMFAKDERSKVVAANPSASIGEIGKELGARWARASGAVKAGYQAKSDKDKARYAAEKAKFAAKK